MNLLIVESPAKGKTIEKFLGREYKVFSSYGHIRDLPKNKLGINVEENFKPKYIIPTKSRKIVNFLKKEIQKTQLVILATDEDREGEAIAWHLINVLDLEKKKDYQRIVFHEITKNAIEKALKNPRNIDLNLIDAQQTRRILDRLVGYKLSPFLWKKIVKGLSAGRVQSIAVRLVCEREQEIQNFKPKEYWSIEVLLQKIQNYNSKFKNNEFEALLVKKGGKVLDKLAIKNKKEAENIVKDLKEAEYKIINIEKKEIKRNPLPPFTTSTLQQEAWQKFRWPAKLTMRVAQQLYETGRITYHRTDSLNLSDLALGMAKKFITKNYDQNYYQFRKYKTRSKTAQEAHEAIRPTHPDFAPQNLSGQVYFKDKNQNKLYELIWRRFIACQMAQAVFNSTIVKVEAEIKNQKSKIKSYTFKAIGQILKFDGFLKVYNIKYKENELPFLEVNEILELIKLIPSQHFTQPLPRYNEASLIKVLEENGIGRPSTYAPILSTIQERNYVEKNEQKRFQPTEIGIIVNDILVKHFPKIVDINFTAQMEDNLDKIAQGKEEWTKIVKDFYNPFEKNLKQKEMELSKQKITQKKTDKICPKCKSTLIIKLGRFGKFYACIKFPECKYTESLKSNKLDIKCPKCEQGEIVEKKTKKKKIFYGCSNWPRCDFALWDKPITEKCPKCKSLLVETKKGQIHPVKSDSIGVSTKQFNRVKCSNKKCDYNT
jgi:DNA topoisomerase-1